MNALTATQPMTKPQLALTLERFFGRVRLNNPFMQERVVQPAQAAELDAEAVHQQPFRRLVDLARAARDEHLGVGAVLWGEAGVGKSHLLARLARWAQRDEQACFVYLQNLQSAPEGLPRSLLRVTVSILTRGREDRFDDTPLFHLVRAAVETALRESAQSLDPERAYADLLDRLSAQAPAQPAFVDRTTYNVLFRFLRSAARPEADDGVASLAVRWLSGDPLDPDDARRLGLPPRVNRDEPVALADDQQIKLVLIALSQMALFAERPLLLCFDQVENVEPAQIAALTRFLQALLDGAPNLLVVTCGVNETLARWRQELVIHAAAWDRVAQFSIALPRVTESESRQILQTRLEHCLTPFMELEPVKRRVQENGLFPLSADWYKQHLQGKVDLQPRQVIRWARDEWIAVQQALEQQGGDQWLNGQDGSSTPPKKLTAPVLSLDTLIDRKVAAKMEEQKQQRLLDPETLPPDADNLAGLVYTLLRQCLKAPRPYELTDVQRPAAPKSKQRPTFPVTVKLRADGREATVGVLLLTTADATSAVLALRRVLEDRLPPERLLLVTDQRRKLRLAAKGKEYYDQLKRNYGDRFVALDLTFEQYAELDALKATGGMALSGDLEIDLPGGEVRRVTEPEVVASHHRADRYATHVLLRPLLGGERVPPLSPPPPPLRPPSDDASQFIMGRLALTPGMSGHELQVGYLDYLKVTKREQLDAAACKSVILAAAAGLHNAGKVQVTPFGEDIYVLPRPQR